ncbi:MAG: hypothetical protein C0507_10445 [Cyanobacteria bacterium PR.3.49]|jgi:hypothetical protein|nr:hypothetical protein [Cyanobacteria bacterium PR.3.49]
MLKVNAYPAAMAAAATLVLSCSPSAVAVDNACGQNTLPVHSPIKMTQLESESGGVFFGGGESESGGVYGGEASTETGGPANSGASSETGGPGNSGASSETGGPGNTGAESDSGGAFNSGASSETGGPHVEIRNY